MSGHEVSDADGTLWEVVGPEDEMESGYIYSTRNVTARVRRRQTAEEAAASDRHMERYAAFMEAAGESWASLCLAVQAEIGREVTVWQTGGMCLALGATIDDGAEHDADEAPHIMITGADGPVSRDREDETEAPLIGVYRDGEQSMSGEFAVMVTVPGVALSDRGADAEIARATRAAIDRALSDPADNVELEWKDGALCPA